MGGSVKPPTTLVTKVHYCSAQANAISQLEANISAPSTGLPAWAARGLAPIIVSNPH